jgi:hypothetical protein
LVVPREGESQIKMKVYTALNSTEKLYFHDTETEADVQAQLFAQLRKDRFNVKAGVNYSKNKPNMGCTFDLVIHKGKEAIVIIEVKSPFEGPRTDLDASHQGLKYRSFGLPVILFWDMSNYAELKEFLKNSVEKVSEPPKEATAFIKNPDAFRRLHKSLDISSMHAYDLGLSELEHDLEQKRDFIKGLMV